MKIKNKKVAIVTGASSGIGKAVVLQFLKMGYTVHATARRLDMMTEIATQGAILHHADLKNPDSIKTLILNILKQELSIDILVNNAGYGSYGAVEEVPMHEARDQIEVNVFAPALLIQEVLPTMRKQRSGKILNVTSIGGKVWSPLGAWYHASKFALEGLSDALRNEVRPFGIDVILIEPGAIQTEWSSIAANNMMKISGQGPYSPIANSFERIITGPAAKKLSAKPQVIADLIAKAVTTKKPKARYVAPFSGKFILFLRWLLNDHAVDRMYALIFKIPKQL